MYITDERRGIKFTVPGEPQGKQRPRWAPRGTYTPKKTVEFETYIRELFAIGFPDFVPFDGALEIRLHIFVSIPESTSRKKRKMMMDGEIKPTKKPDYDNVAKAVGDSLEKIAFKNDNQFVRAVIDKDFSDKPRLEITIKPFFSRLPHLRPPHPPPPPY